MKVIFSTDWHLSSTTPVSRVDNYTDTLFSKIEYLLQTCKSLQSPLILGGDLFNTPTQIDYIKNRLRRLIRKYNVKVYSIVGNHDLLYYDTGTLDRTSYDTMVGAIYPINGKTVTLPGTDWRLHGHTFGSPKLPVATEKTIIISHSYVESKYKSDRLYLHKQPVQSTKARFLCLGHDHNLYNPIEVNGTLVVRPGALSRGTSHTENRTRQISYAVLDLDNGTVEYSPVTIVNKFEDVFKENYEVKQEKTEVSFEEIQEFIDELKNQNIELNPYDILLSMNLEKTNFQLCSEYLRTVGLTK